MRQIVFKSHHSTLRVTWELNCRSTAKLFKAEDVVRSSTSSPTNARPSTTVTWSSHKMEAVGADFTYVHLRAMRRNHKFRAPRAFSPTQDCSDKRVPGPDP